MSTPRDRDGFEGPHRRAGGLARAGAPGRRGRRRAEPALPSRRTAASGAEHLAAGGLGPARGGARPGRPARPGSRRAPDRRSPRPAATSGGFPVEQPVMVPPADTWGTQAWALSVGWLLSDGTGPEDAPLAALVHERPGAPGQGGPCRAGPARPGNGLDLVAFDIVSPMGRQSVARTRSLPPRCSAPSPPSGCPRPGCGGTAPAAWCRCPARTRSSTAAGCCSRPRTARRCAGWSRTRWSASCCSAATTATSCGRPPASSPRSGPTANRPQLIEHHARILAAVVAALAAAV